MKIDKNTVTVSKKNLWPNQPGVVIKMVAKPGKGDELFNLCLAAKHIDKPERNDPIDWVLCRAHDDSNTMWAFEFFRDDESMSRHYAISATDADTERIMTLLAETPRREDVHIVYSSKEVALCQ
jgi:hypothetical protein